MLYSEVFDYHDKYVMGTYARPSKMLVRGEGAYVWDSENRKYVDFTCGIGVCNLGHCHSKVSSAIAEQANKLVHVSNLFLNEKQPLLAKKIIKESFDGTVFFSNSGAEANEGMIKFARKWGNLKGKNEIITMEKSFHGRTLATLAATGQEKYRQGFEPKTPGFITVPFNNLKAIKEAYDFANGKISAILIEPVQGEGGIVPADSLYMSDLRKFCENNEILLMFDEVQSGIGRTGEFFAFKHYGVVPDLLSTAKALGNGYPIGCFIAKRAISDVLTPGTHASTFGGSPLACAAANAVVDTIREENLLDNCKSMSAFLIQRLNELKAKYSFIKDVRGFGLMIGLVLDINVKEILDIAGNEGLLLISAGEHVIRFYPPINVTKEIIVEGLDIFEESLKKYNRHVK